MELDEHKLKLKKISGFTDYAFETAYDLILSKIRFINIELIPIKIYEHAYNLCSEIDEDDSEFVALTEHAKGRLWTGDKILLKGLARLNWHKTISTNELYAEIKQRKKK